MSTTISLSGVKESGELCWDGVVCYWIIRSGPLLKVWCRVGSLGSSWSLLNLQVLLSGLGPRTWLDKKTSHQWCPVNFSGRLKKKKFTEIIHPLWRSKDKVDMVLNTETDYRIKPCIRHLCYTQDLQKV